MSQQTRTEQEYQALLRRLDLALDASSIGVWEHSLTRDIVTWDLRMHKLYCTGLTDSVIPVDVWMNALHPEDVDRAAEDFDRAIASKGSYQSEFRVVWPNGEIRHIRSKATYSLDANGDPAFIGVEWDVTADVELNRQLATQQRIAEERAEALQASRAQIEYAAEHDYLTGLPNRRSFDQRCLELSRRDGVQRIAVMHIDLDRFKQVNDERGHAAGDLVLREAAKAIASASRRDDFVARMGGDEFVLVAVNFRDEDELKERATGIISAISGGVDYKGERFAVSASIGIACSNGQHVEPLLKDADLALYGAKRQGRGQWRLHEAEPADPDRAAGENEALLADLREALAGGQFVPYYQVQRDARTRALAGLEALARCSHPGRGLLLPEVFLPLIERAGLSEALDQHMLRAVLQDKAAWEKAGYRVPPISLNMSIDRLGSPSLLAELHGLPVEPGDLCFEIGASAVLHDMAPQTARNLKGIREMGVEIALSRLCDKGASLLGLLKVRPDRLKIDQSLIFPLTSEQQQLHMIHSLVDLARTFGMKVTAEGIQSPDHADVLRNLGCDTLQGFGFGHPVPRDSVPLEFALIKRDFKG